MARFPFVHNLSTGRAYYGPSLGDPSDQPQQWMQGPQTPFYQPSNPPSKTFWAAASVGALFASGFIPTSSGRVWDHYVRGIRAVEEYSPAAILRTFQASPFFSQFESIGRQGFSVGPELLRQNQTYANYLAKVIDSKQDRFGELTRRGVTLRGRSLFWGDTDEQIKGIYSAIRAPSGARAYYGAGFAHTIGATDAFRGIKASSFFSDEFPRFGRPHIRNPMLGGMPAQIIGGRNIFEYGARQAGAWGTEWVSRFNRLLQAPLEMEPFQSVFGRAEPYLKKIPGFKHGLAVAEGPGLKMFGRLSLKFGGAAAALGLGYQTVDHMFRESSVLDKTILGEGITAGVATAGIRANLLLSRAAEITGLHRYRELQEEIAPGSTELTKLAAFPILGAAAMAIGAFGVKTGKMLHKQVAQGMTSHAARKAAVEEMGAFGGKGIWGSIGRGVSKPTGPLYTRQDWIGSLMKRVATNQGGDLSYKMFGKIGPTKLAAMIGMGIGAAVTLPFLPGAVLPSTRPEELERLYSGEDEVAVRKGRWWEFGRSPYEGGRVSYYKPHWYASMLMRSRDKGIWGEDEPNPIAKLWRKEFTYDLEMKHYKDRPYPITGLSFEDVPFIGPLLANTIGRLIKPPRLMHTEEWLGEGGMKAEEPRFGQRIATEIGEGPGGAPVSPYGIKGAAGQQIYRLQEMFGLAGFAQMTVKEALTGSADWFDQIKMLESSRRMAGFERQYWDLELGGLLGTTEAFRRLYPHRRRQIPLYNPIRNTMPEWLPGAGSKSADFQHGDPYVKVAQGELRLPGVGYEQRYPELKGVSASDYPLIHKYRILADIAPYTDEFKKYRGITRAARHGDEWTDYDEEIFQRTEEQVQNKKKRINFQEYQHLGSMGELFKQRKKYAGEDTTGLLAALNTMHAQQEETDKGGLFTKAFGGYWELLSHNAETAWEQLTPVSPAAKLIHIRSATESYERDQLYGTQSTFWQRPWANFIRPWLSSMAAGLGDTDTPGHILSKRSMEEYFDALEYTKYARLSNLARASNDSEAVKEFESKKDQTMFGLNPFTRNYTSIFRALPRRDRDYFNAFAEADTPEQRTRILEMVPENEKALYLARWKLSFADDVKRAEKAGILTEQQLEEANGVVEQIYAEAKNEGLPSTKELFAEYIETRSPGENYGDWYRRTKLLPSIPMPRADWVGWHPSVDLEDIKLRIVQNLGEDMHDHDMWATQAQTLINKPFINEDAVAAITQPDELTENQMRDRINELMLAEGVRPDVFVRTNYSGHQGMTVDIEQDEDLDKVLEDVMRNV